MPLYGPFSVCFSLFIRWEKQLISHSPQVESWERRAAVLYSHLIIRWLCRAEAHWSELFSFTRSSHMQTHEPSSDRRTGTCLFDEELIASPPELHQFWPSQRANCLPAPSMDFDRQSETYLSHLSTITTLNLPTLSTHKALSGFGPLSVVSRPVWFCGMYKQRHLADSEPYTLISEHFTFPFLFKTLKKFTFPTL